MATKRAAKTGDDPTSGDRLLALRLQAEFDSARSLGAAGNAHFREPQDATADDWYLARRLQRDLNSSDSQQPEAGIDAAVDDDLLFAQQLQAEFDREQQPWGRTNVEEMTKVEEADFGRLLEGGQGTLPQYARCGRCAALAEKSRILKEILDTGCGGWSQSLVEAAAELFERHTVVCAFCNARLCGFCGEVRPDVSADFFSNHCQESQIATLYYALRRLEKAALSEVADGANSSANSAGAEPPAKRGRGKQTSGSGVGYGFGSYARNTSRGKRSGNDSNDAIHGAEKERDRKIALVVELVRELLPNPSRYPETYGTDHFPHPALSSMLMDHSQLFPILSALLRNDSLLDICSRHALYFPVLNLLDTIAMNDSLVSLLDKPFSDRATQQRQQEEAEKPPVSTSANGSSAKRSRKRKREVKENDKTSEEAPTPVAEESAANMQPSIMATLMPLLQQADVYWCAGKSWDVAGGETSDEIASFGLVAEIKHKGQNVVNRVNRLRAAASADTFGTKERKGVTVKSPASTPIRTPKLAYEDLLRPLSFGYTSFSDPKRALPHRFAREAQQLADTGAMMAVTKRCTHIAREVAMLSTSLPCAEGSSVFLRVDEDRPDLLRALITGPAETPYANGCFLFDIFFPAEYPKVPPLVQFRTTGHGAVRFNPNLYNCGTVCLSLLGTWAGVASEKWQTGVNQSTLLQVLMSIQAMILCPLPYFNEPGYGKPNASNAASIAYNANVRKNTFTWAILDALQSPYKEFKDMINLHFWMKKSAIVAQWKDWFNESRSHEYDMLTKLLEELRGPDSSEAACGKHKSPSASIAASSPQTGLRCG